MANFVHVYVYNPLYTRHVPRIRPRGWGRDGGLRGPQGTPFQKPKTLRIWVNIFWRAPFYEQQKSKIFEKSLIRGPTQIATRDPVTSKFEPRGLQRSPKAMFAHPLGSYVPPGAHGIQRSGAWFRGPICFLSRAATCSMGHLI